MHRDAASVLIEGPWEHRLVSANGARFHLAVAGTGPVVVLLHGFPQFWWAWRDQLVALSAAGYRAVALDLRGYGASDKPPRGYDPSTLAADVAGVIRSLGTDRAVIAGQGLGGWLAWTMPTLQPTVTRAVAALSMPHPRVFRRASVADTAQVRANAYLAGMQRPFVPERQLGSGGPYVAGLLRRWAAPGESWPTAEAVQRYTDAMALPFVGHSAAEYFRWLVRSQLRPDGRRFMARIRRPIGIPVLHLHGVLDGALVQCAAHGSARHVTGPFEEHWVEGAGHFLTEEASEVVTDHLLGWLSRLP